MKEPHPFKKIPSAKNNGKKVIKRKCINEVAETNTIQRT